MGGELGGRFTPRSHKVSQCTHCSKGRKSSFSPSPERLVWYENGFSKIGGSGTKIVGVRGAWLPGSHQGYRDDCWALGSLSPLILVAARPESHSTFRNRNEELPFEGWLCGIWGPDCFHPTSFSFRFQIWLSELCARIGIT